jgi:hypothetical protein
VAIGCALQNSQELISIGINPGSSHHQHSPRAASVHAGRGSFAGPTNYLEFKNGIHKGKSPTIAGWAFRY